MLPCICAQVETEEIRPKKKADDNKQSAEDMEELQALLNAFKTSIAEVRSRIGPLPKEVASTSKSSSGHWSMQSLNTLICCQRLSRYHRLNVEFCSAYELQGIPLV